MNIQDQLDRIRAQQTIENVGEANARLVLHAAVDAFRKWLSPVRSPAAAWIGNLETMMVKCRLDGDARSYADMIAVRLAAQVDSAVRPGEYDLLARAAALDVIGAARTGIGEGQRITVGLDEKPDGAFRIDVLGIPVVLRDSPIEGYVKADTMADAVNAVDSLSQRNTGGARYVELKYGPAPKAEVEIFDTVHDPWKPSTVFSAELKAHPTQIIEPSTLAATPFPPATYVPLLPAEAIKRGFISDAQYETIVYALQAVTTYLPGSPYGAFGRRTKGGYIIGDGTGVGKTNEICGIIMDQWMRGIKRHIIVVERGKHVAHIQDAWAMIGGNPRDIFFQGDNGARDAIPDRDGVIVTTYALIRDDRRYEALVDWANSRIEMNGILAFDEAHNMRNAIEDKHDEGSGRKNQSQQGMRGVEIQQAMPEAGVIYASATMATDVYNLGYAPRLGLWGKDAPFPSAEAFIAEMHKLDEGALEQVCIDLKAAGRYSSRTLSFDGVEYEELTHCLTPGQRRAFDGMVKNWTVLNNLMTDAVQNAGGQPRRYYGNFSRMKRELVEQMLSSFNVDRMIQDMHAEIAAGNAPVVQIAYTGEARLTRLAEGREYIPIEEYRDESLMRWIEEAFPETKIVYDKNAAQNVVCRDANGDPIPDAEAKKKKAEAIRIADELCFRNSALDRLLLEFGPDQVAEVTGRSIRAIPRLVAGEHVGWDIEERSGQAAMDDVQAFHEGRKQILVFSLAAGGTGLGYQAAEKSKNKRRRVHYILELGRRAESAVQGLGRTHRSDQVIAPIVKLVTSDVPAHAIYAAHTLAKIQKMGALSRGHQHATTNAIFEQRVPISGRYAQEGWRRTLVEIGEGKLGDITLDNLRRTMMIKEDSKKSMEDVGTAIGQLALMSDGDQRVLVGRLIHNTEESIARAIRQGTYNQGLETIRAESIEIVDENRISNANGSSTTYYRLRKRDEIEKIPFRRVAAIAAAARAKKSARAVFMRHKVNGRIQLGVLREGPSGIVDLYTPAGSTTRHQDALRQEPWKPIEKAEDAARLWELESETLDMRSETDIHILSGSLLYNWDKLPQSGLGLNRCRTDDGRVIVGRVIHQRELRRTLAAMNMQSNLKPAQVAAMISRVDNGATLSIDNGWNVVKGSGGNYRLVIPDEEQTGAMRRDLAMMGVVIHEGPLGCDLEIPRNGAIGVIQSLAVGCDVSLAGATVVQTAPAAAPQTAYTALPLAACK